MRSPNIDVVDATAQYAAAIVALRPRAGIWLGWTKKGAGEEDTEYFKHFGKGSFIGGAVALCWRVDEENDLICGKL